MVSLRDAQGQTTSTVALPADAVRIRGASLDVAVPASLLPPTVPAGPARRGGTTGASSTGYRFTFTAGVPGSDPSHIAGFAPEYVPAPMALARR